MTLKIDLDKDYLALNKVMEFDHPVVVDEHGNVTDAPDNVYAPEIYVDTDEDGQILAEHESEMIRYVESQGWTLLTGYTGQYGHNGPMMHASEFIGGGMAEDILGEPGTYVTLVIETFDDSEDAAGWAVARLDA